MRTKKEIKEIILKCAKLPTNERMELCADCCVECNTIRVLEWVLNEKDE